MLPYSAHCGSGGLCLKYVSSAGGTLLSHRYIEQLRLQMTPPMEPGLSLSPHLSPIKAQCSRTSLFPMQLPPPSTPRIQTSRRAAYLQGCSHSQLASTSAEKWPIRPRWSQVLAGDSPGSLSSGLAIEISLRASPLDSARPQSSLCQKRRRKRSANGPRRRDNECAARGPACPQRAAAPLKNS